MLHLAKAEADAPVPSHQLLTRSYCPLAHFPPWETLVTEGRGCWAGRETSRASATGMQSAIVLRTLYAPTHTHTLAPKNHAVTSSSVSGLLLRAKTAQSSAGRSC